MHKFILILLLILSVSVKSQNADDPFEGKTLCIIRNKKIDTLTYLKQFEINKANYIGKPLAYLLNNMTQIQPKTIWSLPNFKSRRFVYSSQFRFVSKENSLRQNNIFLLIDWQDPIPMSEAKYYKNKNHFIFTDEERSYYGTKIIKDIIVHR